MTKVITRPAALVRQGELQLFTTSLKVSDLLLDSFFSVETLDPDDSTDGGYQRLLNRGRAKKLADYILAGQDTKDAFLPTSIFLATDRDIPFDATNNTVAIELDRVGPFSVVDGQHRIEGLRMAAEKDARVLSFEVPVNIAVKLPRIAQMCHFLIVNTTQMSVEKGVEQRIFARLTRALELEDIPSLPKWIRKAVEKGEDEKALRFADYLNTHPDSPWLNKIEMANEDNGDASVRQRSLVKSIKKFVLVANNPMLAHKDETQLGIFLNYWKAIANVIGRDDPTVLYKYNGAELFCRFSVPFMNRMVNMPDYKVGTMERLLRQTFDSMDGEYAGVGHTEFWVKGGKASFLNSSAINVITTEMAKALHKSNAPATVEL